MFTYYNLLLRAYTVPHLCVLCPVFQMRVWLVSIDALVARSFPVFGDLLALPYPAGCYGPKQCFEDSGSPCFTRRCIQEIVL